MKRNFSAEADENQDDFVFGGEDLVVLRNCSEGFKIACEFDESRCSMDSGKRDCMADLFMQKSDEDRAIFTLDTFNEGYAVLGIEGEILRLREASLEMCRHDGSVSSWRSLTSKHLLEPFPVGDLSKRFRRKGYQSRGSEYHRKCPISLLYVMMDKEKLPGRVCDSMIAKAGTIRHSLATDDCAHSESLESKVPRSMYCERDLEYVLDINTLEQSKLEAFLDKERSKMKQFSLDLASLDVGELVLKGRADALLRLGPNLVVLDFKRGAYGFYEKRSNRLQFGSYAMAVEQLLQEKFSGRILISMNRDRNSNIGAFSLPKPHVTMMERGSGLKDEINFMLVEHYLIRKELLDHPDRYLAIREHYMTHEIKREGKQTTLCLSAVGSLPCFYQENGMCKMIADYVYEGKDLRNLLIDNVVL